MATPRYLPEAGGVENHVMEVAPRLAAAGLDVTVLTTDRTGALPKRERVDGVGIRRVPAWPSRADYLFAPQVFEVASSPEWDLVHVQSYHTLVAPFAMAGALAARTPYVLTFHGGGHSSALRNLARRPQRALLRPLIARAQRLIAVARFEIDLYSRELRLPRERFTLIPNGVQLDGVGVPDRRSENRALIVSIGRLERYKGHHRILAAFPHIRRRRDDARLWIAGRGPYEGALRDLAHRLGVEDAVAIRGIPVEEREDMLKRLAKAAVVVLLSEFESQPLAALEAAALGRPLLVADTSGLRELAEDGLARAVALDSGPEDIAAVVLEELERPRACPRLRLPTWDECAGSLLDLYRSVAGART
jgi:glycosyltransferase involved in cell wall biosynthesis